MNEGIQKGTYVVHRVGLNLIIIDTTTQRDSVLYWDFLKSHYTLNFSYETDPRTHTPDDILVSTNCEWSNAAQGHF